jgi:hypothetical protein
MQDSRFWRVTAVLAVAGLFYVGSGLRPEGGPPSLISSAEAGLAFHNNNQVFFTSSDDGRTVYEWRIDRVKPIECRQMYTVSDEIR